MKDIKTKQKVLSIKTKNVKENVNHFIKQQTIHTRNKEEDKKVEQSVKTNPNVQATNNVSEVAKQTFIESKQRATKFIKHKHIEQYTFFFWNRIDFITCCYFVYWNI